MKIFVNLYNQFHYNQCRIITINVENDATVYDAKSYIERETEYQIDDQRLIFVGKELEDEKTLLQYHIEDETTIYLVIKQKKSCNQEIEKIDPKHFINNYIYDIQSIPEMYRNQYSDQRAKDAVFGYIKMLQQEMNLEHTPYDVKQLIMAFYHLKGSIKILIKTLLSEQKLLDNIWPNYTIETLKQIIEFYGDNVSQSRETIRLIGKDKILQDEHLISDYKITNQDTIHLVTTFPASSDRPYADDWEFWNNYDSSDSISDRCSIEKPNVGTGDQISQDHNLKTENIIDEKERMKIDRSPVIIDDIEQKLDPQKPNCCHCILL